MKPHAHVDHFWLGGTTRVFDTNDVSYGSGTGNFLLLMDVGGVDFQATLSMKLPVLILQSRKYQ